MRSNGGRRTPTGTSESWAELTVDGTEPLPELSSAVRTLCEQVETHTEPRTVVLRVGSASGGQHEWFAGLDVHDVTRWEKALRRLTRQAAVVIVVVNGTCAGPALDLVLSSDYRLCHTNARLSLPVRGGHLWPGMGLHRLVHQLGAGRARQIVLWRRDIDAQEAAALSLVDDVSDDPESALETAVLMFGDVSGPEFAVRRQLLHEAVTTGFDEAFAVHLAACDRELRQEWRKAPWTSR